MRAARPVNDWLSDPATPPELAQRLAEPLELADFLALARGAGYELSEADVIAAQARADGAEDVRVFAVSRDYTMTDRAEAPAL